MALIDHIVRCNTKTLSRFHPFRLGDGTVLGWIRQDRLDCLTPFSDVFVLDKKGLSLRSSLSGLSQRSEAIAEVCATLVDQGHLGKLCNELHACKRSWHSPVQFLIDRQAVAFFGLKAYGVHVNGWVHRDAEPHLWIGRRAPDMHVEPGKLDNMVAGGQPASLSLRDNLVKEAREEAGIGPEMAAQARPVGVLTYCMETDEGLKPDTLFCYDLEVDATFRPRNMDGEVSECAVWPLSRVLNTMAHGQDFKFNVALVIIDFAIRHGVLSPDSEPDYEAIVTGLHGPHP